MIQSHESEMNISKDDFYRLLPFALKDLDYQITSNEINLSYASGNILIQSGIEHERKIASLVLPVLHVVFTFTDIQAEEIEQFQADFNRAYQRGGG